MAASDDTDSSQPELPVGVDPMFMAMHKLRYREFDESMQLCSDVLTKNPYDQVSRVTLLSETLVICIYFATICRLHGPSRFAH